MTLCVSLFQDFLSVNFLPAAGFMHAEVLRCRVKPILDPNCDNVNTVA